MTDKLRGRRVAIIATEGFEGAELREPKKALEAEGAETVVIAPKSGQIKAWEHDRWGEPQAGRHPGIQQEDARGVW